MIDVFDSNSNKQVDHPLASNKLRQSLLQRKKQRKEKERSKEKEKKQIKENITNQKKELKFFPSLSSVDQPKKRRKPFVSGKAQNPLSKLKDAQPEIIYPPTKIKSKSEVRVPATIEPFLTLWYDYGLTKHKSRDTFRFKQDV
ncbi:hypothetical protein DRH13_06080, partial [Candidatus Woesebacteria bacterium]